MYTLYSQAKFWDVFKTNLAGLSNIARLLNPFLLQGASSGVLQKTFTFASEVLH